MFKFEKLIFGDLGWGDEFLIATLIFLIGIENPKLKSFIELFSNEVI